VPSGWITAALKVKWRPRGCTVLKAIAVGPQTGDAAPRARTVVIVRVARSISLSLPLLL